jgi:transcriptional regulator with XRE-family HTH domain
MGALGPADRVVCGPLCRRASTWSKQYGSVYKVTGSVPVSVAAYFGAQLRKERIKAKLSIAELARRMEVSDPHLGRIERGLRQPTAEIAAKLDDMFPRREGAFMELYEASRSWVPAAFRVWSEHEDPARQLFVWSPYTIDGLLQTDRYTRSLLETAALPPEAMTARLKSRMDRQQRILYRDDPPRCVFVVDVLSLYREVGSPAVMAEQLSHLLEVAEFPTSR